MEKHKEFLQDPDFSFVTDKIKEKHKKLASGESDKMIEEQKHQAYPFNLNARRGKANLTIISPFGSALAIDTSDHSRKAGPVSLPSAEPSPLPTETENINNHPPPPAETAGNNSPNAKRTSSSLAKLVDYDDEMEFNMETRGKEASFLLEGKKTFWESVLLMLL